MQEYLLGIDAGTSGVKAIVMDTAGVICGSGYQECDVITPRPSWAEQRPADWWAACDGAVRQAVAVSGVGRRIAGIGLSGQMQGSVLLRRDNTVADTCMIWMDQRSCGEAEELNARLTPEETMRYAANYCLPSFWAAKLLWLRRHQPEVFDSIRKVLFPKDYLRWKMTGEIASEVSDASCTWLLDLPSRQWSDRLFRTAGLSRELVPERLLESQDVAGYLLPDVAERWGLRPGIPVAAGAGDQEAGGVGMGVTRPGTICSTIGTSGVVFGCSAAPFIDPESHGMYSQCHAVPGQYSFLGCTLGAGGSFKWMRDTFFAQQKEALAARGESIYDYMTGLAAEQQPGCGGLVFLPYLGGEGTPLCRPQRPRRILRTQLSERSGGAVPRRNGGRHLLSAGHGGDHPRRRCGDLPDPRGGRRREKCPVAADAGRHFRPERLHDQRGRSACRGSGHSGRCGGGTVPLRRSGVSGHGAAGLHHRAHRRPYRSL